MDNRVKYKPITGWTKEEHSFHVYGGYWDEHDYLDIGITIGNVFEIWRIPKENWDTNQTRLRRILEGFETVLDGKEGLDFIHEKGKRIKQRKAPRK